MLKAIDGVERFRVDGTDQSDPNVKAAERKFEVQGFPTVIFIDASGNEITSARIVGFVDSQKC